MSKIYTTDNYQPTKSLYQKRMKYRAVMKFEDFPAVTEFIAEKRYYGRMSPRGVPVVLRSESLLSKLPNGADATKSYKAIDFVAQMFNEMVIRFTKARQSGQINANDRFLSDLRVYRAYESPLAAYTTYRNYYVTSVSDTLREEGSVYHNMSDFMPLAMNILNVMAPQMPFTMPGFIKSRFSNIMQTGLAIEIADLSYDNDQDKITELLTSPNWKFFANMCNSYGFMIDMNIPWRIVADLESDAMKDLANMQDRGSGRQIMYTYFTPAVGASVRSIPYDLLELYNRSQNINRRIVEQCPDSGKMIVKKPVHKKETLATILEDYNFAGILEIYCHLRLLECYPKMEPAVKKRIIKEAIIFASPPNGGKTTALVSFERFVGKTFDKIGSFEYYMKVNKIIALEGFDKGEVESITLSSTETTAGGGGY